MILVDSEDVWQNYILKEPEAANIRGKSFPYYDDWLVLFGKDRATGELAESATEAVENINLEEQSWMNLDNDVDPTFILPTPVEFTQGSETKSPGSTSSISKGGKKRGKVNEGATKCLADMVSTFSTCFQETNTSLAKIASAVSYAQDGRNARMMLNDELLQLPLNSRQRCRALRLLCRDNNLVDVFLSMTNVLDKTELIEGLLEDE
ncbi:hypothetical protein Dimus_029686 [Dionaea muscipula]